MLGRQPKYCRAGRRATVGSTVLGLGFLSRTQAPRVGIVISTLSLCSDSNEMMDMFLKTLRRSEQSLANYVGVYILRMAGKCGWERWLADLRKYSAVNINGIEIVIGSY